MKTNHQRGFVANSDHRSWQWKQFLDRERAAFNRKEAKAEIRLELRNYISDPREALLWRMAEVWLGWKVVPKLHIRKPFKG